MLTELTAISLLGLGAGKVLGRKRRLRARLATALMRQNATEQVATTRLQSPGFRAAVRQFSQNGKRLLNQEARRQQMHSLSPTTEIGAIGQQDKELNRNLTVLASALGLTAIGTLLTSPLAILVGVGIYSYSVVPVIAADFHQAVVKERRASMAVLETVLIALMLGTGQFFAATLGGFLYILSKKLVMKTEDQSRHSLVNVLEQQEQNAWVWINDSEVARPVSQLQVGDIVVVHAGETTPVDGIIQNGVASVDQQALTGEAQPVEKEAGEAVFASTIVLTGRIYVAVEKAGPETAAAKIREILLATADFKTTMHSRGIEISDRTALPTLGIGALASLAGLPITSVNALMNANFGYNMRVLAPIGLLNSLNHIAQQGILVKDGRALELLAKADAVVFDKTGTLTQGQPHVAAIHTCGGHSTEMVLTYAATAEYKQCHPIAKAILEKAEEEGASLLAVDAAEYQVGYGLKVTLGKQTITVGSPRFMVLQEIVIPPQLREVQDQCYQAGHSLVMIAVEQQLIGALEMHATVRPEAKTIVRQLKERGIQATYIISGDHAAPTQALANELGIDRYFANVLPEEKAKHIRTLQDNGRTVCYIGDGINDSIALKQAHISISLRGASSIATDTASIVLMDGTLNQLCTLLGHAKYLEGNFRRSLYISILPGIISIAGVMLFRFGIVTTILLNQAGLAFGLMNALESPKTTKS